MAGKVQGMRIWRKALVMFALAFALVFLAEGFKIISRAESGTTNNAVNMRKTPSKNGDLVKKLEKGTAVELGNLVDGKDGDGKKWYEVTVGGSSGYIRSDLINKGTSNAGGNDSSNATPAGQIESVTPVAATVAGNSKNVRVRTSADTKTSNNILVTVNKGTEVTVIGKTVDTDKITWYQVKLTVEGREVVGYIRHDYLNISGEIVPFTPEQTTPDPTGEDEIVDNSEPQTTEPIATSKAYETKLVRGEDGTETWYLMDINGSQQYNLDEIFEFNNNYKKDISDANKKAKAAKGWMIFFMLLFFAACGAVGYLIFRLKEVKEEAFIASIENSTPKRTAERPRGDARAQGVTRERPAISRDGLEPRRKEDGQRPANGQRSTGTRPQGQRPAQPGQRPAQPGQGQRPAQQGQGQRPMQPGQDQRAAQPGQGQRPMQPGQGQRPMQPGQGQRPMQPGQGQRPMQPGQGQRPMQPGQGQRPMQMDQRMADGQPMQQAAANNRPKNFAQDNEDMEFEFLNWDSDE